MSDIYSETRQQSDRIPSVLSKRASWLAIGVLSALGVASVAWSTYLNDSPIPSLDREERLADGAALTPSTQSINRYASVLRGFSNPVDITVDAGRMKLMLSHPETDAKVVLNNIDLRFITPMLPYSVSEPDDFDLANLMLAEYSRNGVSMSFQKDNRNYGYFNTSGNVFNNEPEYIGEAGALKPNPGVLPLRFDLTNNCLNAGLWELSASDSAGEIYHSWFSFPRSEYYELIRQVNGLEMNDFEMFNALRYKKELNTVKVYLDRLRDIKSELVSVKPRIVVKKEIGSYSTQDSRRKAQKGYFVVDRQGEEISPLYFHELHIADTFKLKRFVPPGIYTNKEHFKIPFNPFWERVDIKEVEPLTRYKGGRKANSELGYVEITVYENGGDRAVVFGNIAIDLLVEQEDYFIPGFGVGILAPSELIERRYLRLKDGPVPHYAYQIERKDDDWYLLNNHEEGIEQVTIRPFERDGSYFLRITLIAYERILDLIEFEVPVSGELESRMRLATKLYTPPMYRVYKDDNII